MTNPHSLLCSLVLDFDFPYFNANLTLNFGPIDVNSTEGMLGVDRGEGHDGLVLKGSANVSREGGACLLRESLTSYISTGRQLQPDSQLLRWL